MTKKEKTRKSKRKIQYYDYSLVAILVFLICFGLVMLYSTSSYSALIDHQDSMFYFKRQLIFCVVGLGVLYVVSKIDYHWYIKRAKFFYFVSVFLMALVQTPLGKEVNGARRWLRLPARQQLQPAEVAKIAVILFIPVLLCQMGKEIRTLQGIGRVLLWGGFSSACVLFLTDNLSTAIIVFGITCILIFVVHPKTAPFAALVSVGLVILLVGVQIISATMSTSENFRMRRIIAWLNPEEYAAEGAYQTLQGLYAIGSGGLFGKGLGESMQKLGFIPEAQNDMIFSVICEELGLFGAVCLILLYLLIIWRLMIIANNASDLYGALIVVGIMAHLSIQVLLNIAVVTNTIPNTGVSLPFISYGGTSISILLAEMGLALSVSRGIKLEVA